MRPRDRDDVERFADEKGQEHINAWITETSIQARKLLLPVLIGLVVALVLFLASPVIAVIASIATSLKGGMITLLAVLAIVAVVGGIAVLAVGRFFMKAQSRAIGHGTQWVTQVLAYAFFLSEENWFVKKFSSLVVKLFLRAEKRDQKKYG